MAHAVGADGVAGVGDAPHQRRIFLRHAADDEIGCADAFGGEDVENRVGVGRDRAIVEGEHHLACRQAAASPHSPSCRCGYDRGDRPQWCGWCRARWGCQGIRRRRPRQGCRTAPAAQPIGIRSLPAPNPFPAPTKTPAHIAPGRAPRHEQTFGFHMISGEAEVIPGDLKPSSHSFTPAERRLLRRLRTPLAVQRFLNRLPYNTEPDGDTLRGFRQVVRRGTAHCLEAALFAACAWNSTAIRRCCWGWNRSTASTTSSSSIASAANGARWRDRAIRACTGGSRCFVRRARSPRAISIRTSIIPAASPATPSTHMRIMGSYDWRFSRRNVWAVENMLLKVRSRKIRRSRKRVKRRAAKVSRLSGEAQKEAAVLPSAARSGRRSRSTFCSSRSSRSPLPVMAGTSPTSLCTTT